MIQVTIMEVESQVTWRIGHIPLFSTTFAVSPVVLGFPEI